MVLYDIWATHKNNPQNSAANHFPMTYITLFIHEFDHFSLKYYQDYSLKLLWTTEFFLFATTKLRYDFSYNFAQIFTKNNLIVIKCDKEVMNGEKCHLYKEEKKNFKVVLKTENNKIVTVNKCVGFIKNE